MDKNLYMGNEVRQDLIYKSSLRKVDLFYGKKKIEEDNVPELKKNQ